MFSRKGLHLSSTQFGYGQLGNSVKNANIEPNNQLNIGLTKDRRSLTVEVKDLDPLKAIELTDIELLESQKVMN